MQSSEQIQKLAEKILEIHSNDPLAALETRNEISEITYKIIQEICSEITEQNRTLLASKIAIVNVRELSKYFQAYAIENEVNRFEVAKIAFEGNARRACKNFANYEISSNEYCVELFNIGILQNAGGLSKFLKNLNLSKSQKESFFAKALIQDPSTLVHIGNYFEDFIFTELKENFQIEDILNWIHKNNGNGIINSQMLQIYSDMRRRDAGVKLICGIINQTITSADPTAISRIALENLTGFTTSNFHDFESQSTSIGDVYENILDAQSKLQEKAFNEIIFLPELFGDESCYKIVELLRIINLNLQILDKPELNFLERLFESYKKSNDKVEIDKEVYLSTLESLNKLFSFNFDKKISFSDNAQNDEILKKLLEKWDDLNALITLVSRYSGKSSWKDEIPVIKTIILETINDSFLEYRYVGRTSEEKSQINVQIGFLNSEVLESWKKNYFGIEIDESENIDELYTECKAKLYEYYSSLGLIDETMVLDVDILNLNDNNAQKALKSKYTEYNDMYKACIKNLFDTKTVEELKNKISRLKSISTFLRLRVNDIEILRILSDRIKVASKPRGIIFVTTTDDPYLMLNLGSLIKISSCHNPSSGVHIDTIPSYVIDANVKALLGFYIEPCPTLNEKDFSWICFAISNKDCQTKFLHSKKELVVLYKGRELKVKLQSCYYRRMMKLGQLENNATVIRLEPIILQNNQSEDKIDKAAIKIFEEMSEKIGAKTFGTAKIGNTRNPNGTYSDLAGGPIHTKGYEIDENAVAAE